MDNIIDPDNLKAVLLELEIKLRPYVIYVNPRNKETILNALGDLKDKCNVIDSDLVEPDKVYIMKRDSLGI